MTKPDHRPAWGAASVRALALLATAATALAQSTSVPDPAEEPADVVELSPFVVDASGDEGYRAQNTLAGTRINSSLTDTAAPISVFTRDLLDDLAATTIREANEYALNVVNDYGESTDAISANGFSFAGTGDLEVRIRGLNRASMAINYFETLIPSDGYNITRLDFARGPNSILFGVGSPAGIVNSTTKQARVGARPRTEVRTRVDSHGGLRGELGSGRELIAGRLAYRLDLLGEERQTWRVNEGRTQRRAHGGLAWKVNRKVSVRVEGEMGSLEQKRGRPWNQFDLLSNWESLGAQTHENLTPAGAHVPATGLGSRGIANLDGQDRPLVVFRDGAPAFAYSVRNVARPQPVATDVQSSFSGDRSFRHLARDAQLGGDLVRGSSEFSSASAFVELSLARNLFLELAANRQSRNAYVRDLDWPQYGLSVDINRYELVRDAAGNRVPNPHFMDYYVETNLWLRDQSNDSEAFRVMGTYELDLGRRWGRHRFGVLAENRLEKNYNVNFREYLIDDPATATVELFAAGARGPLNNVRRRVYIDDADIGTNRPSMSGIAALTELDSIATFPVTIGPNMAANVPIRQGRAVGDVVNARSGFRPISGGTGRSEITSYMAVMQNYFLRDRLVTTFGFRNDEARVRGGSLAEVTEGPYAGFLLPQLNPDRKTTRGQTRTFGIVARPVRGVSLFYNRATNFNVPDGTVIIFGSTDSLSPDGLPPVERGESQDYGLKFDLLGGRLFLSAGRYETAARNGLRNSGGISYSTRFNEIWQGLEAAGIALPAPLPTLLSSQNRVLFDGEAEGYEFEAVANLKPGWRLMVNYSKSETVADNIGVEMRAYLEKWRSTWMQHPDVPLSVTQPGEDTIAEMIDRIDAGIKSDFLSQQGNIQRGQSEHRANARTSYRFGNDSRLKGFAVGGGARYRSPPITAHVVLTDDNGDVTRNDVIKGVSSFLMDFDVSYQRRIARGKVNWRVQLNINNLLDEDRLQVTRSANDPSRPQFLGTPVLYRFEEPRTFILTNSFTF